MILTFLFMLTYAERCWMNGSDSMSYCVFVAAENGHPYIGVKRKEDPVRFSSCVWHRSLICERERHAANWFARLCGITWGKRMAQLVIEAERVCALAIAQVEQKRFQLEERERDLQALQQIIIERSER